MNTPLHRYYTTTRTLTTCVSVILLRMLPGVGGVLTMGSGDMSGDRPAGSMVERVRLEVPGPKGDEAMPPAPAPKLVFTAGGAAGVLLPAAANGDAAAGGDAAAKGDAGVAAAAAGGDSVAVLLLLPLVLAGASATAADAAAGRADVEGCCSSAGSPNSVSNLSRMSTLLPSSCALSRLTRRCT